MSKIYAVAALGLILSDVIWHGSVGSYVIGAVFLVLGAEWLPWAFAAVGSQVRSGTPIAALAHPAARAPQARSAAGACAA